MPSGARNLPNDVLYDTAVLYVDVNGTSTPIGASRGGFTFNPNREVRTIEYDGLTSPGVGTQRIVGTGPTMSGSLIEIGEDQFTYIAETGLSTSFQNATKRLLPKAAREIFADGDYVSYAKLVYQRANGGTAAVVFPRALCTQYELSGQDKNEATINLTLVGVRTLAQGDDDIPYYIELTGPDIDS